MRVWPLASQALIRVEPLAIALEALLLARLAPLLGQQIAHEPKQVRTLAGLRLKQLQFGALHTQTAAQLVVLVVAGGLSEHDDLKAEQLGDHVDRVALKLVDVDDAAFVADVRAHQRATRVGHRQTAHGVGGQRARRAYDVDAGDGRRRLDVGHHEAALSPCLGSAGHQQDEGDYY